MGISTEETVRNAIVSALESVANTDLEFDEPSGNIKSYLLRYEAPERNSNYLMAFSGGKKKVKAWGVEVKGNDDYYSTGNLTKRTYNITIEGYYSVGINGQGVNDIIKHARKVRAAIKGLTTNLGGTVDYVQSTGAVDVNLLEGIDAEGRILVGQMLYVAERINPDY